MALIENLGFECIPVIIAVQRQCGEAGTGHRPPLLLQHESARWQEDMETLILLRSSSCLLDAWWPCSHFDSFGTFKPSK